MLGKNECERACALQITSQEIEICLIKGSEALVTLDESPFR